MNLIFFSDIHGNRYAFQAFLKELEIVPHDQVVFCGDVFGYYYYTNEIVEEMARRNFRCLLGNHDRMLLNAAAGEYTAEQIATLVERYGSVYRDVKSTVSQTVLEFLKGLKPTLEIAADGLRIGVFHGTPDNPLNGRLYPDTEIVNPDYYTKYDYIVLGHTHHKMERYVQKALVINPGSLGQQRDGKGCSYLWLDTTSGEHVFHVVKYDRKHLTDDIYQYDDGNHRLMEVLWRERS